MLIYIFFFLYENNQDRIRNIVQIAQRKYIYIYFINIVIENITVHFSIFFVLLCNFKKKKFFRVAVIKVFYVNY